MRPSRTVVTSGALALAAALCAACGGGSPSPASPSPTPTTPTTSTVNACGVLGAPSTTSIINGTLCSPVNSPVVKLNMRDKNDNGLGSCSGTIIAPRAILTAAHCVVGDGDVGIIRVFLGVGGDQIQAQSFIAHPRYQGKGSSSPDVGLVFVAEDLPRPSMPLLLSRDARQDEQAIVAGWGLDESQQLLLHAGVTTLSLVTDLFLQSKFSPTSASICPGDSGGPILLQEGGVWAIAGVTSASSDTACNTGTKFFVNLRNDAVASFVTGQVPNATRR